MEPIFTGVATALVTPFNHQQKIDFPALRRLIKRQIKFKADALVILGTTGEISTLTLKERQAVINSALQTVKGQIPLIFGIGGNDPLSIINLGQYVAKATKNYDGKIGIMVTAPYYNKGTPDGILAYYQTITEAVKLPTIVYNIPSRTGVNITPENMVRITSLPFIAGVKEASGDLSQIAKIANLCRDNLAIYSGNDDQILPILSLGGIGVISVLSNIIPRDVHDMVVSYLEGNTKKALELQLDTLDLTNMLFSETNPIPVKAAYNILGFNAGVPRLPLIEMSKSGQEKLKHVMSNYGIIK